MTTGATGATGAADVPGVWWGEFPMAQGDRLSWQVGPASVCIERRRAEWVVLHAAPGDAYSEAIAVARPWASGEAGPPGAEPQRFAGRPARDERIALRPRLADRNVVSRPEAPFAVLPGDEVTAFVGSPVWLALALEPGQREMLEFPLLRPSDTWFGSDTRSGQLCYASRTRCRLRFEDLRWNPHRAVTEVTIRNRGRAPLPVDRINVPVPMLSLWAHDSGMLRTSSLVFTREEGDDELAELEIAEAGPVGTHPLAERRVEPPRGLFRAFRLLI